MEEVARWDCAESMRLVRETLKRLSSLFFVLPFPGFIIFLFTTIAAHHFIYVTDIGNKLCYWERVNYQKEDSLFVLTLGLYIYSKIGKF